jgi:flagellar hook assembly protein FlgD
VDHEQRSAGRYSVVWDGRDNSGNSVGSGMYFYRLETGGVALVKKMLMLK